MKTQKEMEELKKELFEEWGEHKDEMLILLSQEGGEYELYEMGDLPAWEEDEWKDFKTFLKEDISKALINKGKKLRG